MTPGWLHQLCAPESSSERAGVADVDHPGPKRIKPSQALHSPHELRALATPECIRPDCHHPAVGGWRQLCVAHLDAQLDLEASWTDPDSAA